MSTPNLQHQQPSMSCQTAAELYPWLLNGSLEAGERRSLLTHVSSCESCRLELEEAAQAWGLLTQHIPSFILAQYGLGVEPEELDRVRIERHLAACPSCREELERVVPDGVVDFQEARRKRAAKARSGRDSNTVGRHRWAIAAGFAAVLVTGSLIVTRLELWAPGSGAELAAFSEEEADPGGGALFRDGFDSGSIGFWSMTREDESSRSQVERSSPRETRNNPQS